MDCIEERWTVIWPEAVTEPVTVTSPVTVTPPGAVSTAAPLAGRTALRRWAARSYSMRAPSAYTVTCFDGPSDGAGCSVR